MKRFLLKNKLFAAGFLLIILTNILVLGGIYYNRSGEPVSVIQLTERELRRSFNRQKENSGLSLALRWRVFNANEKSTYFNQWNSPEWLDAKKLRSLGFTINENGTKHHRKKPVLKKVFIVLEYDGETYQKAVTKVSAHLNSLKKQLMDTSDAKNKLENAENRLKQEKESESRLFAIDAGTDPEKLRIKYRDQNRYIITKGIVKPTYSYVNKKNSARGYIKSMCVEKIHVPLDQSNPLDELIKSKDYRPYSFKTPRYIIDLAYGKRYEPWIRSVRLISSASGGKVTAP